MLFEINGKQYTKFTNYRIKDTYNALAAEFSINGIGNEARDMIYKTCQLFNNEEKQYLLLTGIVHSYNTAEDPAPTEPNVSGYSQGGILEDVHIPSDEYPLERYNVSLQEVFRLYSFGLSFLAIESENAEKPFDQVTAGVTQLKADFLSKLTIQRGFFLSHSTNGNPLLVEKPLAAAKFFRIEQYITKWSESVNGRGIHSKIVVHLQGDTDGNGEIYELDNAFVTEQRERHVVMKDGEVEDMPAFARKIQASEMMNLKFSFRCKRFVPVGNVFSYKNVRYFITDYEINGDAAGEVISYKAVLESVFQ